MHIFRHDIFFHFILLILIFLLTFLQWALFFLFLLSLNLVKLSVPSSSFLPSAFLSALFVFSFLPSLSSFVSPSFLFASRFSCYPFAVLISLPCLISLGWPFCCFVLLMSFLPCFFFMHFLGFTPSVFLPFLLYVYYISLLPRHCCLLLISVLGLLFFSLASSFFRPSYLAFFSLSFLFLALHFSLSCVFLSLTLRLFRHSLLLLLLLFAWF